MEAGGYGIEREFQESLTTWDPLGGENECEYEWEWTCSVAGDAGPLN